ncbi:hypothetical protein [Desulfosediminicola flagellatus]|uniref:hypothetical protein n=1 Tax=Desulfosediminicola flagellatus TaxID=2569541 RepID=UPI0010ACAAA9|nr:hypothetical protein [Desulfosediminicola flagellatus]
MLKEYIYFDVVVFRIDLLLKEQRNLTDSVSQSLYCWMYYTISSLPLPIIGPILDNEICMVEELKEEYRAPSFP